MTYDEWLKRTGAYNYNDGDRDYGVFHDLMRSDNGINPGIWADEENNPQRLLQEFYGNVYNPDASGLQPFGSEGLNYGQHLNFYGGGEQPDSISRNVTIDGRDYWRGGEDISKWVGLKGLGPTVQQALSGWDPKDLNRYDPTYGYLVPMEYKTALDKAQQADNKGKDGFFGSEGPFQAFSKTVGLAMGLSNLAGWGLNSLASGGGQYANWAASMLPEGGYQSLFSGLNSTNAATGGGVSSLPDSYWNMLADSGQTANDGGSGFYMNPDTGLMDFSSSPGAFTSIPGLSLNSLGNASGVAVNAGLPVGSSMSFLDDLFSAKNLVSLAGNLGSSLIQSKAIDKATGAQMDAAGASNALLRDMYMQNRSDLEPWRATGVNALGRLNALTKPGAQVSEMEMDPGYQFRLNEGVKALDRSAAARGMLQSGAQMKGVTRYGQDYATGEYGNIINRNLALSGLGQAATNTGIQAGQNYGNQASQNLTGAGNARASGYVGNANALSGGIGGFLNNYSQNALLDRMMGSR